MSGIFLPAGYQMSVTAGSTKVGSYSVFDSPSTYTVVAAGASALVGPFDSPRTYDVIELTASVAPAILSYVDLNKHPMVDDIYTLSADGAISFTHGIGKITKSASACALTLVAPTASDDGKYINIISTTARAHTITATNLINNGVTGSPFDLITFAAFAGAGVTLMAMGGLWYVTANRAVTITGS